MFDRLFKCNTKEVQELEQENKILKQKLAERQEVINKTNAYWKKRLREAQKSKTFK